MVGRPRSAKKAKLCARGASLAAVVEVVFALPRGLWRLLVEDSVRSLAGVNTDTRAAILVWRDAVLHDVSLGQEALPVTVRRSLQSTREQLRAALQLTSFLYITTVALPIAGVRHQLPVDVRATQQQDSRCRRALRGRQVQLVVAECVGKGWGVVAAQEIARGEFVGEYTGELVSSREMRRRYRDEYDATAVNYVLSLREHVAQRDTAALAFDVVRTNVDASKSGNVTRFFNHSCRPNLEVAAVRVDSFVPRLAFFARTRIECGEELTFDYAGGSNFGSGDQARGRRKCRCGALECRGFLPSSAAFQ